MRKRSGKRSNYIRTTGTKKAKLSSKQTAGSINEIYRQSQSERITNIDYDSLDDDYNDYNDYYDDPEYSKREEKNRIKTIAVTAATIAAVIAVVIAALMVIRPFSNHAGLIADPVDMTTEPSSEPLTQELSELTAEDETSLQAALENEQMQTETYEASDPPVIYGVMPIVVYAGHSVSYKQGIHVTDDNDPEPVLEIDNSSVDLSTPGTYIITYIARDKSGNETRMPSTVNVLAGQNVVSDEEIYELADSVLDYIITENDITDEQKCLKVYEYLHAIGYVDEVHSEDWMQNAYWMLSKREGDCFCYYSAARLLLTRLGYDVMEVRNNNNYVHFWCLVSTDGGETWWHFDPTCWSWGEDGVLCLVSDAYLDAFTQRHKTSDGRLIHSWDRTKYPATPEYDFWTDEDRAVIYEGGLIEMDPQYDESLWDENDGWDYYPLYAFDDSWYYYEEYTDPETVEEEFPEDTEEYSEGTIETEYYDPDPGETESEYDGEQVYESDTYTEEYTDYVYEEEYIPQGPAVAAGWWGEAEPDVP